MINTVNPNYIHSAATTANKNYVANTVYVTSDYDQFSFIPGNRELDDKHLKRLIAAMRVKNLAIPIIVNERMQIIDGQHRFAALKTLGLPVHFMVVNGYGATEMQLLNTNSSDWKYINHMNYFCEIGNPNYIALSKFMKSFPEFGILTAVRIVGNTRSLSRISKAVVHRTKKSSYVSFDKGGFIVHNIDEAYHNAEKLRMFAPYYKRYMSNVFVTAMIALFNNEEYDHNRMISKLKLQPTRLKDCANATQCKEMLEEIYNYKCSNKVNLRF